MDTNILRIDLTTRNVTSEPISRELRRLYLGGEGINSRLLWDHFLKVDPGIDPLSPDNVLIMGMGPLGASGFGAGSKGKFTFKSPLTNGYGDASCSSGVGAQLRYAGYDHLVITGKAEHPVYLWIKDDKVEVRDARHIWGKDTHETEKIIRKELGINDVEMACIGQAGERLVRMAAIITGGGHRAAAKCGGGAVFGSKNLKAIVARGTKGIDINDQHALVQATAEFLVGLEKDPELELWMRYGTLRFVEAFYPLGALYYRNYQGHMPPEESVGKLSANQHNSDLLVRPMASSPGCMVSCTALSCIKGESPVAKKYAGEWGTKPEYALANVFGMACDIPDLSAVIHLSNLCNRYGMDVIESGLTISLLMELWERGIITKADIIEWTGEDFSLDWGNYEAAEKVLEAMALQKNQLGEMLRDGIYRTAERIGDMKGADVLKYAIYGKGHVSDDSPARVMPAMDVCVAVASIGAHHMKGFGVDPEISLRHFNKPDAGDPTAPTLKGAGQALSENYTAITNSLGVCFFLVQARQSQVPLELICRAFGAVTGVELTPEELLTTGRRVANIQKAFNSRLGWRREDDTICDRWLNEPQLEGMLQGRKAADHLESSKDEYYEYHGWDRKTSLQTMKTLKELDMIDIANVLERANALAP